MKLIIESSATLQIQKVSQKEKAFLLSSTEAETSTKNIFCVLSGVCKSSLFDNLIKGEAAAYELIASNGCGHEKLPMPANRELSAKIKHFREVKLPANKN